MNYSQVDTVFHAVSLILNGVSSLQRPLFSIFSLSLFLSRVCQDDPNERRNQSFLSEKLLKWD